MTTPKPNKVELLAPAGNSEKLEIAIHYGADAVYLGGKDFSLRNFSGNFRMEEIKQAVVYAHDHGVKVYVTVNIFARNDEQPYIAEYLEKLEGWLVGGLTICYYINSIHARQEEQLKSELAITVDCSFLGSTLA